LELKADRVDVKISGRKIIESVSFTLKKGELVVLLGPNGSGKSTLLKTIFGILKPHHGVVYIDRKTINDFERRDIAKLLGYLSQEITSANLKVLDIVFARKSSACWGYAHEKRC